MDGYVGTDIVVLVLPIDTAKEMITALRHDLPSVAEKLEALLELLEVKKIEEKVCSS